jgi:AcrR family transcriptional regulator
MADRILPGGDSTDDHARHHARHHTGDDPPPGSRDDRRQPPCEDRQDSDHRQRLLAGMAGAITDVGYAGATLADIVRRARVSKRTFYEHFATKEDCLLALYEAQGGRLVAEIEAAIRGVPAGEARVRIGTAVYLARLQSSAGLVRTLLVEILHVGERGLAMRRRVMRRFADVLLREIEAAGARTAHSPAVAMALVGGINELILEAVEEDRAQRLGELAAAVESLVRAFLVPAAHGFPTLR